MLLDEIANNLLIPNKEILKGTIFSSTSHKRIVVLQKNGKNRIVFEPNSTIKMCQKYILDNYLKELKYSPFAYAYSFKKSILDMAAVHKNNKYFLHIDIKHYFDSMKWDKFALLISEQYNDSKLNKLLSNNQDCELLRNILLFRNHFRQGSITSPYISNLYLVNFDKIANDYVREHLSDGVYSRYSDDIVISSSSYINIDVFNFLKSILNEIYYLKINYKKLSFKTLKNSIKITGVTIEENGRICLSSHYKKELKRMIYNAFNKKNTKVKINVLYGKIYYLEMVDPKYFNTLQVKYAKDGQTMMERLSQLEKK